MAQRWHWLRFRTTCHPTEDVSKVREALRTCTGLDDAGFDAATEETRLESHHGGEVVLIETTIERAKEIRGALQQLTLEDRGQLVQEVESRTDDHGVFHCRLSKQRAFQGTVVATKGDDAIQMRLKPEVHPASREAAIAAVSTWLEAEL